MKPIIRLDTLLKCKPNTNVPSVIIVIMLERFSFSRYVYFRCWAKRWTVFVIISEWRTTTCLRDRHHLSIDRVKETMVYVILRDTRVCRVSAITSDGRGRAKPQWCSVCAIVNGIRSAKLIKTVRRHAWTCSKAFGTRFRFALICVLGPTWFPNRHAVRAVGRKWYWRRNEWGTVNGLKTTRELGRR